MYIDTMSAADDHDERDERQRVAARQPEHDRARHRTSPTTTSSVGPTRRCTGRTASHSAISRGTDPRCGPQPAIGDVADTETFARDRRDQRDRAAEQHGEQVE